MIAIPGLYIFVMRQFINKKTKVNIHKFLVDSDIDIPIYILKSNNAAKQTRMTTSISSGASEKKTRNLKNETLYKKTDKVSH